MKIPITLPRKQGLLGQSEADNQLTLSAVYDRYAAALLGVITKIISDKAEAVLLLETTFSRIRSELPYFKPTKQPLFVWLLQIARCTALDALKERTPVSRPALQLTKTGQVIRPLWGENKATAPGPQSTISLDPQQNQLLDMILFKNCTPEEAAQSLGIPVETVRQQLRLAMQQVQSRKKAS